MVKKSIITICREARSNSLLLADLTLIPTTVLASMVRLLVVIVAIGMAGDVKKTSTLESGYISLN